MNHMDTRPAATAKGLYQGVNDATDVEEQTSQTYQPHPPSNLKQPRHEAPSSQPSSSSISLTLLICRALDVRKAS